MNFDKLQEQWKSEPQNIPEIPKELDKIKEAHNPIDKVRSNMKKELIVQSVLIIAVAFFPFLNIGKWDSQLITMFVIFYVLMVGFMLYYGLKFYRFYKESYNLAYDSRKNLMWFSYELRLFIELYRALTFIMMFLGMAFGLYWGTHHKEPSEHIHLDQGNYLKLLGIVLLVMVALLGFIVAFAEVFIRIAYGRYLKQINKILAQLDEI
ncbi:hypothetical protein CMU40_16410 [Elizabethkingia anophelis]|uniref:hypothetical protein n=1 Tax=Elizabethkingia anophelis TaxID=1117645 RepID=UPI0021A5B49F|nr:hypothetical protein [Elizabethkingia anophelis]MCT3828630.1 hypothetical protein [Elizabethkingia anophelis]MCT3839441.1 hypothetical protein [Elizabethkingia anophelis]MCT3843111.1 hypothetical protein [Elizabethkingia anophelis]MCT3850274.1 hypothetical protein [Elizabethkingia anophelis]